MSDDKQRAPRIERKARDLLDAMDRQHGEPHFSQAVSHARAELRAEIPRVRAESDRSRQ